MRDVSVMSWRRFLSLLRGLSPTSRTVIELNAGREYTMNDVAIISTPELAQKTFVARFGPRSKVAALVE